MEPVVFSLFSAPVVFHRQIIGEDRWHQQLQQVLISHLVSVIPQTCCWEAEMSATCPIHRFLSVFKATTQRNQLDYSKVSRKGNYFLYLYILCIFSQPWTSHQNINRTDPIFFLFTPIWLFTHQLTGQMHTGSVCVIFAKVGNEFSKVRVKESESEATQERYCWGRGGTGSLLKPEQDG